MRGVATRTPSSSALRASASQTSDHAGQEVVARGPGLVHRARRRARRTSPIADIETSAPGRSASVRRARPSTRFRVPSSRDSRIRCFAFAVQRCATFSPSRWITPSRPASASGGGGSAVGSAQRTVSGAAARQDGHLVPAGAQRVDHMPADQAGAAGDGDPLHFAGTGAGSSDAFSATALATAALTSRLKTLGTM